MTDDPRRPAELGPDVPRLLQELVDQVAAAVPILERIAAALERGGSLAGSGAAAEATPAVEFRAAVEEGNWDRAEAILDGLRSRPGGEFEAGALAGELDRARGRRRDEAMGRLEAAREAGDADGVIAARDELVGVLGWDEVRAVDREQVGWLMKLIQRRLRAIPVGADVAALAARVADRFGGTPEGASLKAALPTLRRSAGLCPRCAEPYLGVDDACPKCLEAAGQAPAPTPTLTFVGDDLDSVVEGSTPIDLNDAATWDDRPPG